MIPSTAQELAKQLAADAAYARDKERRERAAVVLNAYYGGPDWEQDFQAVLMKIFKDEDKADRPRIKLGVVKRFGDTKATVFQRPPSFKVMVGDDEAEEQTKLWREILKKGRWYEKLRTANLHEHLLSTIHLWPRRSRSLLKLEVISPAVSIVFQDPEDPNRAGGIAFRRSQASDSPHKSLVTEERWVFWGRERHFTFTFNNNTGKLVAVQPSDSNPNRDNPYRLVSELESVIPIKVDAIDPPDDAYWGQPATDLVELENAVNAQIMAMAEGIIDQGFSISWSRNIPKALFEGGRSPGTHYAVEKQQEGEIAADMGVLQLAVDVDGMKTGIEFQIQQGAVLEGLPPSAFRIDKAPESGFSKQVDRVGVLGDEEGARDRWRNVLAELFEVTKRVWNVERRRGGLQLEGEFHEEATLVTDFPEDDELESEADRVARWKEELSLGTMSPVDVMMEKNPDLERDEAVTELQRIAKENARFRAGSVLAGLGLMDEEGDGAADGQGAGGGI